MKTERLAFLDGVRALMALNVVLNHFVVVYYPQMYFQEYAEKAEGLLPLFARTPLSALVNGNIGVQYFFLLTGFLAAMTVAKHAELTPRDFRLRCVNRYFRLLPVVAAATAFTFLTMVLGLQRHQAASAYVANAAYLQRFCSFTPGVYSLLRNIFVDSFVSGNDYVGPFWTIRYELFGYLLCLFLCWLFSGSRVRRLAYTALAIVISQVNTMYLAFILGAFVFDLFYYTERETTVLSKYYHRLVQGRAFPYLCLAAGAYFACCPMYYATIYRVFEGVRHVTLAMLRAGGVALLLYALLRLPAAQRPFTARPLQWLGKLSFALYAFHWPVMLCLQSGLFLWLIGSLPYDAAALIAFFATLPVILACSYLAWRLLEKDRHYDVAALYRRIRTWRFRRRAGAE